MLHTLINLITSLRVITEGCRYVLLLTHHFYEAKERTKKYIHPVIEFLTYIIRYTSILVN